MGVTVDGPTVTTDGADRIFGDLGNDWIVGGTGKDQMFGGWGDDLLNADDNLDTAGGLNTSPDTNADYEDIAYGGAGRDRLIGNTGGDRLIDWAGEFNSYIVPFAPFGNFTISRAISPQLPEYLYALAAGAGADQTRTSSTDPVRRGEPDGELGLVKQQDFAWRDQTGAPDDPQPGNIPGGARDVLRSANFNTGSMEAFAVDSGAFQVKGGVLEVTAKSLGQDAAAVFHVGEQLPAYFEVQASITVVKPTSGWKANSFVIFDYQSETDFKFAGLDVSLNKIVMGHRDETGWHVDAQGVFTGGLKAGTTYNVLVAVNGLNATVQVNNSKAFSYTYAPRVVDGYTMGLNQGLVGVGSDNSRGTFDNVRVQVLPPQYTLQTLEDFSDGSADQFAGGNVGNWSVTGGRYAVDPGTATATSLVNLGVPNVNFSSVLQLSTTVNTQGRAGIVFDRYDASNYKFAAIDIATQRVILGHSTAKGVVIDASYAMTIQRGVDYTLGLTLKGGSVSVTLNGNAVTGFVFNASTVDGRFGLLASGGTAAFDNVLVKSNDPVFTTLVSAMQAATTSASGAVVTGTVTDQELQPIVDAAIERLSLTLSPSQIAALQDLPVVSTDLPGWQLGAYADGVLWIDTDAAGNGWFVDRTARDDREFRATDEAMLAVSGPAAGRMDLLTVVMHELAHAAGEDHGDGLMAESLELGTRLAPSLSSFGSLLRLPNLPAPQVHKEPVIDWRAGLGTSDRRADQGRVGEGVRRAHWTEDFVNHLGRSEAEREPNAKLRVVAPSVAAKVVSEAARRIGAFFR
jgi:hypothetical protein